MRFLTDRKLAVGTGSARAGTEHHWSMIVSAFALLILVPLFIFTFGHALGMTYAEAIAYYSRPFPAIVAALTLLVGFVHFKNGVQILIEDYVHGPAREITIIAMICLSYAAAATGVFAIAKIAF